MDPWKEVTAICRHIPDLKKIYFIFIKFFFCLLLKNCDPFCSWANTYKIPPTYRIEGQHVVLNYPVMINTSHHNLSVIEPKNIKFFLLPSDFPTWENNLVSNMKEIFSNIKTDFLEFSWILFSASSGETNFPNKVSVSRSGKLFHPEEFPKIRINDESFSLKISIVMESSSSKNQFPKKIKIKNFTIRHHCRYIVNNSINLYKWW